MKKKLEELIKRLSFSSTKGQTPPHMPFSLWELSKDFIRDTKTKISEKKENFLNNNEILRMVKEILPSQETYHSKINPYLRIGRFFFNAGGFFYAPLSFLSNVLLLIDALYAPKTLKKRKLLFALAYISLSLTSNYLNYIGKINPQTQEEKAGEPKLEEEKVNSEGIPFFEQLKMENKENKDMIFDPELGFLVKWKPEMFWKLIEEEKKQNDPLENKFTLEKPFPFFFSPDLVEKKQ